MHSQNAKLRSEICITLPIMCMIAYDFEKRRFLTHHQFQGYIMEEQDPPPIILEVLGTQVYSQQTFRNFIQNRSKIVIVMYRIVIYPDFRGY